MEAIVLVGGLGTRLRPYTWVLPKPLLPLGETSILEITLRQLGQFGFSRVTLAVGHKASFIKNVVSEITDLPFKIDYLLENEPRGTAGFIFDYIPVEEKFLVLNGDLLTDLNFKEFLVEHRETEYAASVACISRSERIDYGVLVGDENDFLTDYQEKPISSYQVSSGIYALTSVSLKNIRKSNFLTMPDLLLNLSKFNLPVKLVKTNHYWMDLGRTNDYHQAIEDFQNDPSRFLGVN